MAKILAYRLWHKALSLMLLLLLCACSGERCIEADDFGHATFTIPARYSDSKLFKKDKINEVAPWLNTGYRVNGNPLYIIVRNWSYTDDKNNADQVSAWCPWYGKASDGQKLASICANLAECEFDKGQICIAGSEGNINNPPCLMKNGLGLYALVHSINSSPNASIDAILLPRGVNFHVYTDPKSIKSAEVNPFKYLAPTGKLRQGGGIIYKYTAQDQLQYKNVINGAGELYFKILDNYYSDNSGQYKVVIKSGVVNNSFDPIKTIQDMVIRQLFGANKGLTELDSEGAPKKPESASMIPDMYKKIINNPSYHNIVLVLLTLYIIYLAVSYITGMIDIGFGQLVIHMFKIVTISMLINSKFSWDFFYNYFFVFFIEGTSQVIALIQNTVSGPGESNIFAFMMAQQTLKKLASLLFVDWLGWLYILLYFFLLFEIFKIYIAAAVIIITSLLITSVLIILAPIFLCFVLFEATKELFENWLRQLMSYAFQPIILCVGLIFLGTLLRNELYSSLGFAVCRQPLFKLSNTNIYSDKADTSSRDSQLQYTLFTWWFPSPSKGIYFTKKTQKILVPIGHFDSQDETKWCKAYECEGRRYIDLPFLDPEDRFDQVKIKHFHDDKFVQFDGLFILFLTVYLLNQFNNTTLSIARHLTGTSMNAASLNQVNQALGQPLNNLLNKVASNPRKYSKAALRSVGSGAKALRLDKAAKAIGKTKFGKKVTKGAKATGKMLKKTGKSILNIGKGPKASYGAKLVRGTGYVLGAPFVVAAMLGKAGFKAGSGSMKLLKVAKHYTPNKLLDRRRIRNLRKEALTKPNKAVMERVKRDAGLDKKALNLEADKDYKEALKMVLGDKMSDKLFNKNFREVQNALANNQFGKKYSELSEDDKKALDLQTQNLNDLHSKTKELRDYEKAYVKAYAKMSDEGSGLASKALGGFGLNSLVKLNEFRHKMKQIEKQDEDARVLRGKNLLLSYDQKKAKYSFGLAGNAWDKIDTNPKSHNYSMLTYAEKVKEEKAQLKREKFTMNLDAYNRANRDNVTTPEFLAKMAQADEAGKASAQFNKFYALAKEDIKWRAKDALLEGSDAAGRSGRDPAFLGDVYLEKYATQKEMKDAIDQIHAKTKKLLEDDPHIQRAKKYQEQIKNGQKILNDLATPEADKLKQAALIKQHEAVLTQIDERKKLYQEEMRQHVLRVNNHMKKIYKTEYRKDE